MLLALMAAVQILGFSPGDKQVAYLETGANEGSGEAYAKLHVIDIAKNAGKVTSFAGQDAAAQALKAASSTAWAKPRTIEHDDRGELSDRTGAPIGTLELTTRKAAKSSCDEPFDALLLKVVIHFMDDDKPTAVGSEKSLPKMRPCASSCALDKVYAHGKAALVLVKCVTPGFEGKGETITAFAKSLPYGLDEDLPPQ
jgi:predicted secreted protein